MLEEELPTMALITWMTLLFSDQLGNESASVKSASIVPSPTQPRMIPCKLKLLLGVVERYSVRLVTILIARFILVDGLSHFACISF